VAELRASQLGQPTRWRVRILALCLPLAALVLLDLGLRGLGLAPADDPLLFHARSHGEAFSPFVEDADGTVRVRPDWVNPGNGLRGTLGTRRGRHFLYPGFRATRFAREKPTDTLRIFALGGSTTFGLYVGAESAFPAVLEERLRERAPEHAVEVINLGCAGWASDRVVNLLPAVLGYQPDLLVVYTGHNERLAGHPSGGSGLDFATRLRARLLSVSTLFAWLDRAITSTLRSAETELLREEEAAAEAGRILTYEPRAVPTAERELPDDAYFHRTTADYGAHLRQLIADANSAGVPVLLVLPVPNLLFPPSISAHGEGFEHGGEFLAAMEEAGSLRSQRRYRAALPHLQRAVALSPRHALAHYQLGTTLLELGRREEALAALQRANDLDVRTHRITADLEAALVDAARREDAAWVDLRPVFRRDLGLDATKLLFVDHLHPTPRGHTLIAEQILPVAVALLALPARDESPPGSPR
jgi:lysophospholipase L1-like esterase